MCSIVCTLKIECYKKSRTLKTAVVTELISGASMTLETFSKLLKAIRLGPLTFGLCKANENTLYYTWITAEATTKQTKLNVFCKTIHSQNIYRCHSDSTKLILVQEKMTLYKGQLQSHHHSHVTHRSLERVQYELAVVL